MNSDRHAILSLVAMGRITCREAERLLAVSREGDDTILRLALCLAFAALALPYMASGFDAAGSALAALLPPIVRAVSLMAGMV
ncbi:MAG TPA: hypothetical protein VHZ28_16040 [Terracidiphilus sp.]|jgi:hypothetical protein|nr:hypothetical protein [Terracidiphilus sp.]